EEGAVLGARELLADQLVCARVGEEHADQPVALGERLLDRLGYARAVCLADDDTVDDDVDVVLHELLEVRLEGLVEGVDLTVDAHGGGPLSLGLLEPRAVLALAAADG